MNLLQYLALGIASLLSGLTMPASASLLSGLTMPASAEDYQIKITKMQDLNFGSMLVISSGTVILDPKTGHFSGTASVIRPASLQKGTRTGPAEFLLTCFKKKSNAKNSGELEYEVELDKKPNQVLLAGRNSSDMRLKDYQMYSSLGFSTEQIEDDREIKVRDCSSYRETIYVGATLTLDANQQPGHYTNDDLRLEVSFDYDD